MKKSNIKCFSFNDLKKEAIKAGAKEYSANQIIEWLYEKRVYDFFEMSNLSLSARRYFDEKFFIGTLKVLKSIKSKYDGTTKLLLECGDNSRVECVFLPHINRNTICLSSQVGCKFKCSFCATGKMGFKRNLFCWEIMEQFIITEKLVNKNISNVVFMGMGEPLDNYEEVKKAIGGLKKYFKISGKNIVVSTSGFVPGLKQFVEDKVKAKLSFSLNAATEDLRSHMMPINKKYSLKNVMNILNEYVKYSGFAVTFEYVLIAGVNDSMKDAKDILNMASGIKCKINIVPLNKTGKDLNKPGKETIRLFYDYLKNRNINVSIRQEKGADIKAACGQLAAIP